MPPATARLAVCLFVAATVTPACGTPTLSSSAPSAPPPSAPELSRGVEADDAPFVAVCAELPSARPSDLVLRYRAHDYDRPEALARWALVATGSSCPEDDASIGVRHLLAPERCVTIPASDLDALYASVQPLLASVRTRPAREAPHRAGVALVVSWGEHTCRAADVLHDTHVEPSDRERFRSARDAIVEAIRRGSD